MSAILEHAPLLGVAPLCEALGVPRATYYRSLLPAKEPKERKQPARALSEEERHQVLSILHEERFLDLAPAEVYATLLDEGRYLCSERTMYRLLAEQDEVKERRAQLRHPAYAAPELLATGPNQLWSWDITKLWGPAKWTYYYLYVLLDVFSRYVVGWMVALRESATLAERLIEQSCKRQQIQAGQLTLHADRGSSMTSKTVAFLLADLGVTKTHSRPYVSNDNPYSEAQFKTLKYRPEFPERFGSLQHARQLCREFFAWYNEEHHHSGIGLLTPHEVHYGLAEERLAQRQAVLRAAYQAHPERFVSGMPKAGEVPREVWINKPKEKNSVPEATGAFSVDRGAESGGSGGRPPERPLGRMTRSDDESQEKSQ